jgi:hypothetical protein
LPPTLNVNEIVSSKFEYSSFFCKIEWMKIIGSDEFSEQNAIKCDKNTMRCNG